MQNAAGPTYVLILLALASAVLYGVQAPAATFLVTGGLAIGTLYYLLSGLAVVAVFVRAALAFVPIAAIAGALIYWLVGAAWLAEEEERALIAATVVAAGWVVAFVTGELRQVNQEQERRRDIIRATLAEIDLIVDWADPIDWAAAINDMKDNFYKNRNYQVFVFYGHQYGTLRRLTAQIEILSKPQILPVTELFQLLDRMERMEVRMGEEIFAKLPWQRRQQAVIRYLELQAKVPAAGRIAAEALRNRPFHGLLRRLT